MIAALGVVRMHLVSDRALPDARKDSSRDDEPIESPTLVKLARVAAMQGMLGAVGWAGEERAHVYSSSLG